MKHVSLTTEAFLLLRPDAPSAATAQNITHNTMIGSPGGSQSVVATATLHQPIPGGLLAGLAELEAEFTSPHMRTVYGELVDETREAATSGDQGRIAKALAKIKHFLSMVAVDAASQLTIAGAAQLPAIVQSLNS